MNTLLEAWRRLASHYRGNPGIYGYDLLNEPVVENYVKERPNPWRYMVESMVKTIRAVDPETPIIVELGEADFARFAPLADAHIIYSPHIYAPHSYSHQGVLSQVRWGYPGEIDGIYWDKEQLRVQLKPVIEFQRKYHARIFVGEFSTALWSKGGDRYLADCIALFEEYGWDWTYHAFREWPVWSVEHEATSFKDIRPSADNPRKRALLAGFAKNRQ